ncbi:MAG: hypothetical protein RR313_06610 [Anaerovoracaceae bacterium]
MLNNKKVNMIISLVIAIGLWAYVLGEINPATTETIKDIPIVFVNETMLDDQGLAILEASDTAISITVSGQRSRVSQLEKGDVSAVVDLAEAEVGDNQLKIMVRVPEKVEIDSKSISKVSVVVEERVSQEKDVKVRYEGTHPEEEEPTTVEVDKKKIVVTGAKTLVNKVAYVSAPIKAEKVGTNLKTFKTIPVAVEKDGEIVENVRLSSTIVSVSAVLNNTKTVPLDVPVINMDSGDIERTVAVPKVIIIKGSEKDLANVDKITAEPIDASQVVADAILPIVPILPDGIAVAEGSGNLAVKITAKGYITKTFQFDNGEINIVGEEQDSTVTINTNEIKVTIVGKESDINSIAKEDILLSIDVSNLGQGPHRVGIIGECNKNYSKMTFNPNLVKVSIE